MIVISNEWNLALPAHRKVYRSFKETENVTTSHRPTKEAKERKSGGKKRIAKQKKGNAKNQDIKSEPKRNMKPKIRRLNGEGGNGGARAENVKASVRRGGEGISEGYHRERGYVNIESEEEGGGRCRKRERKSEEGEDIGEVYSEERTKER